MISGPASNPPPQRDAKAETCEVRDARAEKASATKSCNPLGTSAPPSPYYSAKGQPNGEQALAIGEIRGPTLSRVSRRIGRVCVNFPCVPLPPNRQRHRH